MRIVGFPAVEDGQFFDQRCHGAAFAASAADNCNELLDPEACLAFTMENCSLTRIDYIEGPGMGHNWRVITVNRPPK